MTLVHRRDGGVISDLLAPVGGVGVRSVVVNAYVVVGVAGEDGDLDGGREDVWGGDVEIEDGGVLEDETGFVGLENGPYDEDYEEDEKEEDYKGGAEAAEEFPPLVLVVAALFVFSRHGSWVVGGGSG